MSRPLKTPVSICICIMGKLKKSLYSHTKDSKTSWFRPPKICQNSLKLEVGMKRGSNDLESAVASPSDVYGSCLVAYLSAKPVH